MTERTKASPGGAGETDHDAMRAASMLPLVGPDDVPLAAGGGLELPGRQSHPDGVLTSDPVHEPIPGERDADTLMWREPGSMGGQFSGAETPPADPSDIMAERTRRERALEGGGDR